MEPFSIQLLWNTAAVESPLVRINVAVEEHRTFVAAV